MAFSETVKSIPMFSECVKDKEKQNACFHEDIFFLVILIKKCVFSLFVPNKKQNCFQKAFRSKYIVNLFKCQNHAIGKFTLKKASGEKVFFVHIELWA